MNTNMIACHINELSRIAPNSTSKINAVIKKDINNTL